MMASTNPVSIEVPGAVQRMAWIESVGPTAAQKETISKAKEVTYCERVTSTGRGQRYTLARCVMVPELVIAGDDPQAEVFCARFPNHKKIYDLNTP